MTVSTRLTVMMAGLVLAMAIALGLLARSGTDLPVLFAGLAVVLAILILTVMVAHYASRPPIEVAELVLPVPPTASERVFSNAGTGFTARAFDRIAEEKGDDSAKLTREQHDRRQIGLSEQYAGQERMFIAAVESANYPVIAEALDGTITAWNPAAERLYGFPAAEAIGSHVALIIPSERHGEQLVILEKVRREEPIESFETVRMAKDGRRIDVAVSMSPIRSPRGNIVAMATISRDITAQKFAEGKFRLAVEACPSGMVMIDAAGKIVLVNGETERLFGYLRDELIGQSADILAPERFRAENARHRECFPGTPQAGRIRASRDLFGRHKDGTEFPVEVSLNPIESSDGPLVLSVIVDITERKRTERLRNVHVDLPAWDHAASGEIDTSGGSDASRILLCEDDPQTAIVLRERLRQIGFVTDFAHTAADALTRAAATPYAAFLVDLQLPDGDGIGLILDLRALPQYRDTPIVVVSANASSGREDHRSPSLNVLDWLSKPVDVDRLGRMLRRSLDPRSADTGPWVLHVDDDCNVLALVAEALGRFVEVVSVDSLDAARRAIAEHDFDLAILDIALAQGSGLDLLPNLRGWSGLPIPVIVFSVEDAECGTVQVEAALNKSRTSLGGLVAAVQDRLALRSSSTFREVA
jgi:PAS domain S-box-containing protein